jgi:hypothetical protein
MSALLVSEVQHGGIIGQIPPLHQPKSNLRGDAYLLIARTMQGRSSSAVRLPKVAAKGTARLLVINRHITSN